ncbi:hypothetical protein PYCC9005_001053 [Savitreella phatthalungensis]
MAALSQYNYVFAIGTFFALFDAFNIGSQDIANSWATSVSSRSVTYRQAMMLGTVFELLGAVLVGARTADTIKNGIIPYTAFKNNAGVQMLAFTCALAAASLWVFWCTRHNAHVSSTYSIISAVAGVGVATAGASKVQWGWNNGKGLGAIFAGLFMAPTAAAGFGAIIFMLIKTTVLLRRNPAAWAVYTSPFFFLIAGTICALSIVYKGSPKLGLNKKPHSFIIGVSLGTGGLLALLAALFFVPYVHAKVIKKDHTVRWYHLFLGPILFTRPAPADSTNEQADVPNYAVVQDDDKTETSSTFHNKAESLDGSLEKNAGISTEQRAVENEVRQVSHKELVAQGLERMHAKMRKMRGPLGWAMRHLHNNPMGAGTIFERKNLITFVKRLPAMAIVGALYGMHFDIHAAQAGVHGTPDGDRMARVYAAADKYPNEVEHSYAFVQIITACTASFAHGANDVSNAVGPWAVIYKAWHTGKPSASKAAVDLWQIAVVALAMILGFVLYGYRIMSVMGNKLTYHSPSRGSSMELGAAITVLVFSQYALPVSTSMCITGATLGVGLCNGRLRAVNWQRFALLVSAWIFTIPVAGTLAGLLMGIILNAPHF